MNKPPPRLLAALLLLASAHLHAQPAVPVLAPGLAPAPAQAPAYDPLAKDAKPLAAPLDVTLHDQARKRDLPLRIYLPKDRAATPVILFSHGLGGSCKNNAFMGQHWAARGYVAVFVQHPGSDSGVWQNQPVAKRLNAMRQAASLQNFILRAQDIPAVLDQLALWNQDPKHALSGRLDMKHIGMSGHSFGAITTQAVSGQKLPTGQAAFTDPRIVAAVAFSPSIQKKLSAKQAFGEVKIPWLLMTGTKDTSFIGGITVADRLNVFPALPKGGKYEVVLDKAEHSAFSDRALPGDKQKRNPNHHRVILALSTAFWDAYLKGDEKAKAWLDGGGAKGVLEKGDGWRRK